MKVMWKHAVLAVLGFALVASAMGCGSSGTTQEGTPPPASVGAGQGRPADTMGTAPANKK